MRDFNSLKIDLDNYLITANVLEYPYYLNKSDFLEIVLHNKSLMSLKTKQIFQILN